MIKGYCRSNIDEFKGGKWPERFVAVPEIGDFIKGPVGMILKVCSIIHCQEGLGSYYELITLDSGEPFIIIELGRV